MLSGKNTHTKTNRFVACRYRDFWTEQGPTEIISLLQRGTITLPQAADLLNTSPTSLHGLLEQVKKTFQFDVIIIQMARAPEKNHKLFHFFNYIHMTFIQ